MTFSYAANWSAAPLGPFTTASKTLVWGQGPAWDDDSAGHYESIVAGKGKNGGPCCQTFYPKGTTANTTYQVFRQSSGVAVTSEFDFKFVSPFDLASDLGKVGMAINWGALFGPNEGISVFFVWGRAIAPNPGTFSAVVQDQSGNQAPGIGQPVHYYQPAKVDTWYNFAHTLKGGPGGYAKFYLNKVLFASYTNVLNTTATDPAVLNHHPHYGGYVGPGGGPKFDCWALADNHRYYSGDYNPSPVATITSLQFIPA